MAVKTAEKFMIISLIKALLLKNADCQIKDNQGNLPEDFINDYNQSDKIISQLANEVYKMVH